MKLGIMQPYFFPYIGYFQLINAVDAFVFYDDVNFIKGGWVNRNRIVVNNSIKFFTVPLSNSSSFTLISETKIKEPDYFIWRDKFFKTLNHAYKGAPFYNEVSEIILKLLKQKEKYISDLARKSILAVLDYLEIKKEIICTSQIYANQYLERQNRILDICKQERSKQYVNLIGGRALYDKERFENQGIKLKFIEPLSVTYRQFSTDFVSSLSIIDVLMFNSKEEVLEMLDNYKLVE